MRISIEKRFFSLLLAFVMVLSLMPLSVVEVLAASLSTTVLDEKISISGSDDNSLGTGTDNGDGSYTFTMVAESKEECVGTSKQTTYTAKSHTITITNTTQEEVSFSFSYAAASFGAFTIDGTDKSANATGTWEGTLAGGASVVFVLTSVSTNNTTIATLTLSNFVEASSDSFDVTVQPGVNGVVTVNGTAISANTTVTTDFVTGVAVTATANSGYVFLGWQDASGKIVSSASSATIRPNADMTVSAVFAEDGVQGYWSANGSIHPDLNEACQDALNGDGIVVLLNDATLPAGNYTIPAGVTVLIPFDAANTIYGPAPEVLESPSGTQIPSVYRTLTMADGATVTVNGNLEVGAKHHASHGGSIDGGVPYDYFGHIVMNGSSAIVVENGGSLFAWGYVTGSDTATVTAKSGAKVYEKMQVSDYRGGRITSAIVLANGFPFNQYYIQNVEVKETLEYGSTLICHAGIYGDGIETSTVDFMGSENAMFTMSEGTTVTKYYDAATDRLIVEAYGDISMNAISIMGYDTSKFILPFNHNITVNIKSGAATINQDIMLQPGATINVDNGASLTLASGKKIILMDASDWGNYCFGKQLQQISYVPSKGGAPNIRQANSTGAAINLSDAKINVNGTFNVIGQMYASSSGALIVSVGKTGVINFTTAAPTASFTFKQSTVTQYTLGGNTVDVTVYPALLTNGNATTINTNGITANTTYNYCATCDCWYTGQHVFEITLNVDGSTSQQEVHAGKTPVFGTNPTKESDANSHYTFAGWATTENGTVLSAIPAATADATYYAVFTTGSHDKATITEGKHYCSACGYLMGSCTDSNFDHICEVGLEKNTTCVDDDKDHVCDYTGCKAAMGTHADGDDADHICDYCNGDVGESCYGGTATCMAAAVCSECGQPYGTVNSSNHTGNNTTGVNAKNATCTEDGYTGDTVCECGVTVASGEVISATGHDMQETTAAVAPGCETAGSTAVLTCANGCGKTEGGEEIAAKGHDMQETTAAVAPGCETAGSTAVLTCANGCGKTEGGEEIAAKGHDMQETTAAVAPTCTTAGSTAVLTCANGCGHTEGGEEVAATGHSHNTYGSDDTNHWSVCSCGEIVENTTVTHTYVDGTCVCGAVETVTNITVVSKGVGEYDSTTDTGYSVSGNVVTVKFSIACKVGYLVDGSYVAITAVANDDGSYSFTAPEGVTEVLLVVKGDVTLDGKILGGDTARLNASILGKTTLTAEALFAGEVTGDGKILGGDTARLNASILGKTTLTW